MGPPRGHVGGTGLGVEALTAEPPATHTGEPRQARKGATVSRSLRVIGDHLARAEALGHAHRTAPDGGPHGPNSEKVARGGALHLLGPLSEKSSHGSMDYVLELLKLARRKGCDRVFVHLITDGRSTQPGSAPALLRPSGRDWPGSGWAPW